MSSLGHPRKKLVRGKRRCLKNQNTCVVSFLSSSPLDVVPGSMLLMCLIGKDANLFNFTLCKYSRKDGFDLRRFLII